MIPEVRPTPPRSSAARHARGERGAAATDGDGGEHQAPTAPLSPDVAASIADEVARRTELVMVAQRKQADADELVFDHIRTQFDLHEQERAEYLREWNAIRDLAMEQMKKDDDILKKWIALI